MKFMNEYDLTDARHRFISASKPNRLALVLMVERLAEWTDQHSDGWAYWPKPCRAAARAIGHIESRTYSENREQEETDVSDAEMAAAARPVKAFLTRQKVSAEQRELILRSVTS